MSSMCVKIVTLKAQISDVQQEQKNVDLRLRKGRGSLFNLLGSAFAYKCLLSPAVKLHLYQTFDCPILRSGLSTFVLRENTLEYLCIFQRKTLRSILKLSKNATNPALYFLCGDLPIKENFIEMSFLFSTAFGQTPNLKSMR